ncbi:hypothetical protein WN48_06672 [Eufriesea mexicana]|uniref:Uncharacterized protein n=1 Tax=Eufriesea mexicana TaxID=516756 RepID=A0A310S8H5_9HYME|nr:hypothetical protein WN48_06672 [Eufriesea mexicana]
MSDMDNKETNEKCTDDSNDGGNEKNALRRSKRSIIRAPLRSTYEENAPRWKSDSMGRMREVFHI